MSVYIPISYEMLLDLVEQLPKSQQTALIHHLQKTVQSSSLTKEEKKALLKSSIRNIPLNQEPSIRREDWYDDEGR